MLSWVCSGSSFFFRRAPVLTASVGSPLQYLDVDEGLALSWDMQFCFGRCLYGRLLLAMAHRLSTRY